MKVIIVKKVGKWDRGDVYDLLVDHSVSHMGIYLDEVNEQIKQVADNGDTIRWTDENYKVYSEYTYKKQQ